MPKKLRHSEPPEPEASIQKMRDHTDQHAANIEQVIKESAQKPEASLPVPPVVTPPADPKP